MGRRRNKASDSLKCLTANITINSFANANKVPAVSSGGKSLLPKSFSASAKLCDLTQMDDMNDVQSDEEDDDEVENKDEVVIKKSKKRKSKSATQKDEANYRFIHYDIWELIGNYILPCSIGRFAAISKDCYRVVQRSAFWIKLYRDFYNSDDQLLPTCLQPERVLDKVRGIRRNVILSLFYTYKPFTLRLQQSHAGFCDPHQLKKMICVKFWHQKRGCSHFFYFKFAPNTSASKTTTKKKDKSSLQSWDDGCEASYASESVEDIYYNPEEGYQLLFLSCEALSCVSSSIIGQKLSEVCLTMCGQGFRYHKLNLSFVPVHSRSIQCSELITVDILNIVSMKTFPWFHPLYIE